jgi:hypothetical protein
MAAALATLDILEADGSAAMAHMQRVGALLGDGLREQAREVPARFLASMLHCITVSLGAVLPCDVSCCLVLCATN